MPQCTANKQDGTPCQGVAQEGDKWCSYHQRKYAKRVTSGTSAAPELLGIPKSQHITFNQFYEKEKPLELREEVAYLRTLLVELRQTIDREREDARDLLLQEYTERVQDVLRDTALSEEEIAPISEELKLELADTLLEHIGPVEPLTVGDITELRKHIEGIGKVAEKAKKIKDGFVLTVDLGNVQSILSRFIQHVVLSNVDDRYVRSRIVEDTRHFIKGGVTKSLPGAVIDV